jgi:hypothetical protein
MNEPIPIRERKKQSPAVKVFAIIVLSLAALGVIEAVVLITLAATGQIG